MNAQKKSWITVLLVAGFVFVGLVMMNGCKKEEPVPAPTDNSNEHEGHDHGEEGHAHDEHSETAMTAEMTKEIASTGEQTTCPIMEGKPINKAIFTEYKGKKVYFCCPACDGMFKKDPEKYIAKLPQFKE